MTFEWVHFWGHRNRCLGEAARTGQWDGVGDNFGSTEELAAVGDSSRLWHRMLVHGKFASNSSTAHGVAFCFSSFQVYDLLWLLMCHQHCSFSYISNLSLKNMVLITSCCHFWLPSFCAPMRCDTTSVCLSKKILERIPAIAVNWNNF